MIFILLCTFFALSHITEATAIQIHIRKDLSLAKRLTFENEVTLENSEPNEETTTEELDASHNTSSGKISWVKFLKEIGLAASFGCTIGALSSSLCQTLESQEKIHWVGCWFLSAVMRATLLNAIMPSFKENNIPHNPKTISTIAWATDWIVYVYKKNFLATLLS